MVYKVIGLMSGSSLDGLDMAYVHLQESRGKWSFEIAGSACCEYPEEWKRKLSGASTLGALDYQLLHVEYGHWMGQQVNAFMEASGLQYQVQLIASHGHTVFHRPGSGMTAQLGDGASLAASTGINTVSDLRSMDMALGGQGAPLVPTGEKLLWQEYDWFLNLGGIANLSHRASLASSGTPQGPGASVFTAFDVCPANRVMNLLAAGLDLPYDKDGALAAAGRADPALLQTLNELGYYAQPAPKSLANEFGTDTVFPLVQQARLSIPDALRTYVEHICTQVENAIGSLKGPKGSAGKEKLLVTGGGAHNGFLVARLRETLEPLAIEAVIPDAGLIDYKEALIMALIGVLRWREENNVYASVTGAKRNSIGGAVWIGQEA